MLKEVREGLGGRPLLAEAGRGNSFVKRNLGWLLSGEIVYRNSNL